uniref:SKICH domain-containing protein n=1 Tax=Anisakis simplex TaxID=6269 RepID=A0A0M3JGK4_ANISI
LHTGFSFDVAYAPYEESIIYGSKKFLNFEGQTMLTYSPMKTTENLQITAWNVTFDKLKLTQHYDSAAFTSWIPLDQSACTIILKVNKFFKKLKCARSTCQFIHYCMIR